MAKSDEDRKNKEIAHIKELEGSNRNLMSQLSESRQQVAYLTQCLKTESADLGVANEKLTRLQAEQDARVTVQRKYTDELYDRAGKWKEALKLVVEAM